MRIAIDTQSTLGHKTGIGLYTTNLLRELRQVAPQHEYVELSTGRTEELRTPNRMWREQLLPRQARTTRADILHLTGFGAPRWSSVSTLLTVHDLIGMLFPANLPPIARFYWAWWLPRSIRWASQLVADSEHTRHDLIRLLGIPGERVEVIPLGVDAVYHPVSERSVLDSVRQTYHLPSEFILYLGTLEPRKGLDTLVAAFVAMAADSPLDLVIAGKKGWYTDPLFRQVEASGLGQRVHFTDYVREEDLPALYNLARLFVYPSRYEGFGLPVLEAMASGTPVVCSNAASLPEVAGDAALMVPPDNAALLATTMHTVLSNPTLQDRMRADGVEWARRFSWAETARKTAGIYERMHGPK